MPPTLIVGDLAVFAPFQAVIMTGLLLLMFAVALTGVCSVVLWCYLFVWFDKHFKKRTSKEVFL